MREQWSIAVNWVRIQQKEVWHYIEIAWVDLVNGDNSCYFAQNIRGSLKYVRK